MQEDMDAAQADEISPDEQQLEVLEDIWLKAGEIGMCICPLKFCSDYLIQMLVKLPFTTKDTR